MGLAFVAVINEGIIFCQITNVFIRMDAYLFRFRILLLELFNLTDVI